MFFIQNACGSVWVIGYMSCEYTTLPRASLFSLLKKCYRLLPARRDECCEVLRHHCRALRSHGRWQYVRMVLCRLVWATGNSAIRLYHPDRYSIPDRHFVCHQRARRHMGTGGVHGCLVIWYVEWTSLLSASKPADSFIQYTKEQSAQSPGPLPRKLLHRDCVRPLRHWQL